MEKTRSGTEKKKHRSDYRLQICEFNSLVQDLVQVQDLVNVMCPVSVRPPPLRVQIQKNCTESWLALSRITPDCFNSHDRDAGSVDRIDYLIVARI